MTNQDNMAHPGTFSRTRLPIVPHPPPPHLPVHTSADTYANFRRCGDILPFVPTETLFRTFEYMFKTSEYMFSTFEYMLRTFE